MEKQDSCQHEQPLRDTLEQIEYLTHNLARTQELLKKEIEKVEKLQRGIIDANLQLSQIVMSPRTPYNPSIRDAIHECREFIGPIGPNDYFWRAFSKNLKDFSSKIGAKWHEAKNIISSAYIQDINELYDFLAMQNVDGQTIRVVARGIILGMFCDTRKITKFCSRDFKKIIHYNHYIASILRKFNAN